MSSLTQDTRKQSTNGQANTTIPVSFSQQRTHNQLVPELKVDSEDESDGDLDFLEGKFGIQVTTPSQSNQLQACVIFEDFCKQHGFSLFKDPSSSQFRKEDKNDKQRLRRRWQNLRDEAEQACGKLYIDPNRVVSQDKSKVCVPMVMPARSFPPSPQSSELSSSSPASSSSAPIPLSPVQSVSSQLSFDVKQAHKDVDMAEKQRVVNVKELTEEKQVHSGSKAQLAIDNIRELADQPLNIPANVLMSVSMLSKAVSSQPDVVVNTSLPDRQNGLRRVLIAGYKVVESIAKKIAQSTRKVLYTPDVQSLAVDYAAAQLEKAARPPGKDGSGGMSYDASVDLGSHANEVYAVVSIYMALETDLIMWRASPHSAQPCSVDWKKMTLIAGFVMAGGAIANAMSSGVATALGLTAAVFLGASSKSKVLDAIHRSLFPTDTMGAKLRNFLGLQKSAPQGDNNTLMIATNLDLAAEGYSSQEYAAMLPQHFPLSPPETTTSSACRQHHLDAVQALTKDTMTTNSGGLLSSSLSEFVSRAKASQSLALSQHFLDIIPPVVRSAQPLVPPCHAYSSMVRNWSSPQRSSSTKLLTCSPEMRAVISFRKENHLSPWSVRRGSIAFPRPLAMTCAFVLPTSTGVLFPPTSPPPYSAKENGNKFADVIYPPHLSPTSTIATSARATTSLNASSAPPWSHLPSVLKKCGTKIRSFTSTCQAQTKTLAIGIQSGIKNLAKKTPQIWTAQGWTQLSESLQSSFQSQSCGRLACLRRLSDSCDTSSEIAERYHAMGLLSKDDPCCEPEFLIRQSQTLLSQRQPSSMAQLAVEVSEAKTGPIVEKETTASASIKTFCAAVLAEATSSSDSSSSASEDTPSASMNSAAIASTQFERMPELSTDLAPL